MIAVNRFHFAAAWGCRFWLRSFRRPAQREERGSVRSPMNVPLPGDHRLIEDSSRKIPPAINAVHFLHRFPKLRIGGCQPKAATRYRRPSRQVAPRPLSESRFQPNCPPAEVLVHEPYAPPVTAIVIIFILTNRIFSRPVSGSMFWPPPATNFSETFLSPGQEVMDKFRHENSPRRSDHRLFWRPSFFTG